MYNIYGTVSGLWTSYNNTAPARYGHSAVLTPDSKAMLVYGGQDNLVFKDDLWAFHFGRCSAHTLPLLANAYRIRRKS
jgi:hypothetical protein